MKYGFISIWRMCLLAAFVFLCFGAIFWRLYTLHIRESTDLAQIAERNREKVVIQPARRGKVVDLRGNLLAVTRTVVELGVDPEMVEAGDKGKSLQLARLINLSPAEIDRRFRRQKIGGEGLQARYRRWRKLADGVDEKTYEAIRNLEIEGVYGNRKFERIYPGGPLAGHLVGFLSKDGRAVSGIERLMDFYLRGQDGWRETEKDGRRRELAQFRRREVNPVDGLNIETSIDVVVQTIIEEKLEALRSAYQPESATIIVSEPSTGYILGLANEPHFDPNRYWKYPMESHRNRAVSDVYEPGSTFKIVAASGVLNENLVELETMLDCGLKVVQSGGSLVKLPDDYREFGLLSVKEVVSKSSNRGAAQLGVLLGRERLNAYTRAFGFGERTGYRLGGEVRGRTLPASDWGNSTISRLPIGYAVNATPLQIHFAMSVIANEGILMSPRVVRRIFDDAGNSVGHFGPRPRRRVIGSDAVEAMKEALREVVRSNGTAPSAGIVGYDVAGKTGTARKLIDGQYSKRHHIASFSGFFPALQPRLLITILVNDPQTDGPAYGGRFAAPVFREIAKELIEYYAIQPVRVRGDVLALKGDRVDRRP